MWFYGLLIIFLAIFINGIAYFVKSNESDIQYYCYILVILYKTHYEDWAFYINTMFTQMDSEFKENNFYTLINLYSLFLPMRLLYLAMLN